MDYDNDGTLDFISGSYDPGDVYLFRGLGDGKYAKRKTLVDENDLPLVHHPVEFAKCQKLDTSVYSEETMNLQVASFGSWVAAADWDGDQDLDMLIGSFGGELFLRENIGTRKKPKYSGEAIAIKADGKPLKESCHAAPVVADWDSDGLFDLVIGSGDGSVGWYKNIGSASEPKFGARNLLVSPAYIRSDEEQPGYSDEHATKFLMQKLTPSEQPIPGARAQICVYDYNNDGQLDLIVGDQSNVYITRDLSDKEQAELESLEERMKADSPKLQAIQKKLYSDSSKELTDTEKQELEEEYQALVSKLMKLAEEYNTFFVKNSSFSCVWLYLHKSTGNDVAMSAPAVEPETPASDTEERGDRAGFTEGPVSFFATLEEVDDQTELVVEYEVDDGWHLYADAGSSGSKEVAIVANLPEGVTADGDWNNPPTTISPKSTSQKLYKGSGAFTQRLACEPDIEGKITVVILYQVCNAKMCLPSSQKMITVRLE